MSFDFSHAVSAPFRMQPGLRRLAPGSAQLTPQRPGGPHLAAKLAVLRQDAASALLQRPGFDPAAALASLAAQAAAEHPAAFRVQASGTWQALWLGMAVSAQGEVALLDEAAALGSAGQDAERPFEPDARAAPSEAPPAAMAACLQALPAPWRQPALLALAFAEDFAIVDGRDASIPWLAVALPSHWAPAEKVGRHFAEVHAPVADNRLLLTAGEHLMRLVTREERWERFVWNLTRHAGLDNHPHRLDPAPWPPEPSPDEAAALACFRTERQTFIPVPGHDQAVFTILVQSQPLRSALAGPGQAAQAAALHAALATMSAAVLAYRDLAPVREPLLAWLAERAGTTG